MDAMADDWESIMQIRRDVNRQCGPASDEQIFAVLRELRADKLVEIMKVPGQAADILETHPESCWFGMTDSGRELWESESVKHSE